MLDLSRRHLLGIGAGALAATAIGGTQALANPSRNETGWVRSTLARMTLEQKVGQLMVQQVYGVDPTVDDARNLDKYGTAKAVDVVRDLNLGGVIYFAWTDSYANGPTGVAKLSNALQRAALAPRAGQKVSAPLIIATDQEQGIVTRFGPPATQFPGSMALGAGRSTSDARTAAAITGKELRAVGINTNFAPDADVNVNPANPVIGVRSFGSRPDLVSGMVAAQVKGYQQDGDVSASAKHFPGHGDTATDSHYGLPVITHSREEWQKIDAPPFKAAIAAGVDMIMSAHLLVPALDPVDDPATLSKPILTGVLRHQLGYEGVIITDSLEMAGVREKYGDNEVAVKALEAGVDILLMAPKPVEARDAITAAIGSGRLQLKDINAKVERVLRMKYRRGLVRDALCDVSRVDAVVGAPAHLSRAAAITDRTITLVRNEGVLPMPVSGKKVLVTGWGTSTTTNVANALTAAGATVQRIETGTSPKDAQIAQVVAAAATHDLVVVLTMNVASSAQQVNLVNRLQAAHPKVVAVAVRNPYDVAYYEAGAELCTYSYSPVVPPALVRVITGQVNPQAKLPVDVPRPDGSGIALPFGFGLSY